ncbi:MAG: hypothetical protein JNL67_14880 [Planctomycetaceae bacterium]|nr:hypothetical protein [Planctomycetaceae bacterium]
MKKVWTLGLVALASVSLVGCGADVVDDKKPTPAPSKEDMKKAMDEMQSRMKDSAGKGGKGYEGVNTDQFLNDAEKRNAEAKDE